MKPGRVPNFVSFLFTISSSFSMSLARICARVQFFSSLYSRLRLMGTLAARIVLHAGFKKSIDSNRPCLHLILPFWPLAFVLIVYLFLAGF